MVASLCSRFGFSGGQLAALDSLRDLVLLMLGTLANLALGIGVLNRSVVFAW
jgi:hypothetical protein